MKKYPKLHGRMHSDSIPVHLSLSKEYRIL